MRRSNTIKHVLPINKFSDSSHSHLCVFPGGNLKSTHSSKQKSDIAKLLNFPAFRHTNLPELWVGDQDEWTDPKGDQVAAR